MLLKKRKIVWCFQTADASPWTENHRESSADERDKAQIDTVLDDFTEWVNQHSTELPEFDSAMLFTGYVVFCCPFASKCLFELILSVYAFIFSYIIYWISGWICTPEMQNLVLEITPKLVKQLSELFVNITEHLLLKIGEDLRVRSPGRMNWVTSKLYMVSS